MFGYLCPWRFSQDIELLEGTDTLLYFCLPCSLAPTWNGKYSILAGNDSKWNILISGEGHCFVAEFMLNATLGIFWPLNLCLFLLKLHFYRQILLFDRSLKLCLLKKKNPLQFGFFSKHSLIKYIWTCLIGHSRFLKFFFFRIYAFQVFFKE